MERGISLRPSRRIPELGHEVSWPGQVGSTRELRNAVALLDAEASRCYLNALSPAIALITLAIVSRGGWRARDTSGARLGELGEQERAKARFQFRWHLGAPHVTHQTASLLVRAEVGAAWRAVPEVRFERIDNVGRQRLVQELGKDRDRVPARHNSRAPLRPRVLPRERQRPLRCRWLTTAVNGLDTVLTLLDSPTVHSGHPTRLTRERANPRVG